MYARWRLTSAVDTLELMRWNACVQQSKTVLGSPCDWKEQVQAITLQGANLLTINSRHVLSQPCSKMRRA